MTPAMQGPMRWARRIRRVAIILPAALLWQSASLRAEPSEAPQKASVSACDRAGFRVVLDVGHSDKAWGAISARGQREYDFNLRLATLTQRKLLAAGFAKSVLLVTQGPAMKSLHQRVARANQSGAELFLSIHHDSVPDKFLEKWQVEGVQRGFSDRFKGHSIFVSNSNRDYAASLSFAKLLGKQLKARDLQYTPHYTQKIMGHRQRILVDADAGVYRYDQLIVLKDTRMPAVLLEAGSIINRDEELKMESMERQSLISAAVVDAVDSFCAARHPHKPEQQIAGHTDLAGTSKPAKAHAAAAATKPTSAPAAAPAAKPTYAPAAMLPSLQPH
jgi:N-acetylmuramoyl-L-alanine amidase